MNRLLPLALLVAAPLLADGSHVLAIKIDPAARQLYVEGTATLPAADRTITFALSPHMTDVKVRLPRAKVVSLHSEEKQGDRYWTVRTDRSLPPQVTVSFSYRSDTEAAPQFAICPEGSFAGGGGELWYPQADFKVRDTGSMVFTVPRDVTVTATGTLVTKRIRATDAQFVFRVTYPSKFAFAAGPYIVQQSGGTPSLSLYLLRDRMGAKEFLPKVAGALGYLQTMFGPLPYDELRLVEVDFPGRVLGTSEYEQLFVDDAKLATFDLSYWAHEIGHQWWGNLVRSRSGVPGGMLLSEGVAQLGALWSVEAVEGAASAERFRRSGYEGGNGQSAKSYFQLVEAGVDMPLATTVPSSQSDILTMHRLANTKGFLVLDMLARIIGRDQFIGVLRSFIAAKRDTLTSWPELRQSIQEATAEDMEWFFTQWTEREGAPYFHLTWIGDVYESD
ncbi:MAG TPA: M1 family aminopeptidase, partial [Thermoanaerobaculia bacterium]|nr:M1 family aminopeptidase [Thermoanaerobaculia bacterium]